jgi:hypothetical protein
LKSSKNKKKEEKMNLNFCNTVDRDENYLFLSQKCPVLFYFGCLRHHDRCLEQLQNSRFVLAHSKFKNHESLTQCKTTLDFLKKKVLQDENFRKKHSVLFDAIDTEHFENDWLFLEEFLSRYSIDHNSFSQLLMFESSFPNDGYPWLVDHKSYVKKEIENKVEKETTKYRINPEYLYVYYVYVKNKKAT